MNLEFDTEGNPRAEDITRLAQENILAETRLK
jgi:hypothetical protein